MSVTFTPDCAIARAADPRMAYSRNWLLIAERMTSFFRKWSETFETQGKTSKESNELVTERELADDEIEILKSQPLAPFKPATHIMMQGTKLSPQQRPKTESLCSKST